MPPDWGDLACELADAASPGNGADKKAREIPVHQQTAKGTLMSLKEAAAVTAAQSLSKVFKQLESGGTNPADVRSANGAMDLAEVLGVTAADYARLLRQDEARP